MTSTFRYAPIVRGALLLIVFAAYFVRFSGPAESYWDSFVSCPASHIVDRPVEFVGDDGSRLYEFDLAGRLPDNLVDEASFGIVSKDQRLGAAVFFSIPMALFNLLGFRLFHALSGVLLAVSGYGAARSIFDEPRALTSAALLSLNPYVLTMDRLSPSFLGAALLGLLVCLLLRDRVPGLLLGLLYGVILAVVEVSVLFFPAIAYLLWRRRMPLAQLLWMGIGVGLVIAPMLYWNRFAYGGLMVHPTQHLGLEGFRPVFEHRFFFWRFDFNGLLNFPFHHTVVRTPHFPYPSFLLFPMVLVRSFGVVLAALTVPGLLYLRTRAPMQTIFLLLWLVPFSLFLACQENLDEWKVSYILFITPALVIFMTGGIAAVTAKAELKRSLALACLVAVFLGGGVRLLRSAEFPADQRWYERFPKAALPEATAEVLRDEERVEWYFYHTGETEVEVEAQRRKMTAANLLPARYLKRRPREEPFLDTLQRELETRRIVTIDMWERIYGRERHDRGGGAGEGETSLRGTAFGD